MRAFTKLLTVATVALGAASFSSAALASQTKLVASFNQVGAGKTINWIGVAPTGGKLFTNNNDGVNNNAVEAIAVDFLFGNPVLAGLGDLSANFTYDATAASGSTLMDFGGVIAMQQDIVGSFSFIYTGAGFSAWGNNYSAGTNLLSGTFSSTWLTAAGDSGGAQDSYKLLSGSVNFTSDVVTFGPGTDDFAYAISLTGIAPTIAVSGQGQTRKLNDFNAFSAGNFSAAVPEPGTWALMILGFGGAGAMLRSRRRAEPALA